MLACGKLEIELASNTNPMPWPSHIESCVASLAVRPSSGSSAESADAFSKNRLAPTRKRLLRLCLAWFWSLPFWLLMSSSWFCIEFLCGNRVVSMKSERDTDHSHSKTTDYAASDLPGENSQPWTRSMRKIPVASIQPRPRLPCKLLTPSAWSSRGILWRANLHFTSP